MIEHFFSLRETNKPALVVDGSSERRNFLKLLLAKTGIHCVEAEAFDFHLHLESAKYGTIFLEVQDPDLDGKHFIQRLKVTGAGTYFIAIVESVSPSFRERLDAVGFHAFVLKTRLDGVWSIP